MGLFTNILISAVTVLVSAFSIYNYMPLQWLDVFPSEKKLEMLCNLYKEGYFDDLYNHILIYRLKRPLLDFKVNKREINENKFSTLQFHLVKTLYDVSVKRTQKEREEELEATKLIPRFFVPSKFLGERVKKLAGHKSKNVLLNYAVSLRKLVGDTNETLNKYKIPYQIKGNRKVGYELKYNLKKVT